MVEADAGVLGVCDKKARDMSETSKTGDTTEDGKRQFFIERKRKRSTKEWMRGGCGVLQVQIGKMLTGVTWQMTIILLVLIEVVINIILLLILFKAIKDTEDHLASNLLHFFAITILSVFVLEICLKIYALGIQYFWLEKWEMLDAFAILVAFTIEVILRALHANEWKGLELIIVLRLWRVVRLVTVMASLKEEFYELIEDEIDARREGDQSETETESLQKKN